MSADKNLLYDDDDEGADEGEQRRFSEFECPDCSADNPHDESFGNGDEVRCYYCGVEYRVTVTEGGKRSIIRRK